MHQPVLLTEIINIFNPQSGDAYIDATVNGGGHAKAILERIGSDGFLLGIDRDCDLIEQLRQKTKKEHINNFYLECENYANLCGVARKHHFTSVDGIIFDLGFSSYHIEKSHRGFSFGKPDERLDMRYRKDEQIENARDIVNRWPEEKIAFILKTYGEERFSGRIARHIAELRRRAAIERVGDLVAIVQGAVPAWYRRRKIHFATRTFQALRIAVNDELGALAKALPDALNILSPGGKIAVISFHSLEDRIVKYAFRDAERDNIIRRINKKAIRPSRDEQMKNHRSRSAILRVAQKI